MTFSKKKMREIVYCFIKKEKMIKDQLSFFLGKMGIFMNGSLLEKSDMSR